MPRIALAKGRLLEPTLEWLQGLGFQRPDLDSRTLSLPIGRGWEAVLLKGPDVPVFVQNGAADLGVAGSDILEEDSPDVYDLQALGFGRCRLSLAAPAGWKPEPGAGALRVATKYPRLAERCLGGLGYLVQPIRVSSSAELAPLLGLSEVIVDIVDSGRTLRENGLEEVRTLCPVEAHLIAGRRSYRFLQDRWWEELRDNANLELRIED
jgi:ATP phosphoribosyltransferase